MLFLFARTREWSRTLYETIVELEMVSRDDLAGIALFALPDGTHLQIVRRQVVYGDDDDSLGQSTGLAFYVDDIEAAYAELKRQLVRFDGPICPGSDGSKEITFIDPSENRLRLVELAHHALGPN